MKKGFTLIELLIVIALIGILSSIAYPMYQDHLTKVRRTYAVAALVDLSGRMEEYYLANNTYIGATLDNLRINSTHYKNYYRLNILAKDNIYVLHAIPSGKQSDSDTLCGTLTLDQNGNRTNSSSGSIEKCWY